MCFNPYSLGQILIQQGSITRRQAVAAGKYQLKNRDEGVTLKFGEICVGFGYCEQKDLDTALLEQDRFCIKDHDRGSLQLQALRQEIAALC